MLVTNNFYTFHIEKWKSCLSCKLDIVEIKILCELMHDVNIQKIIFSKIKFHFLIMKNTKKSSKKFSAYIFETKKHVSEMKLEGSIK